MLFEKQYDFFRKTPACFRWLLSQLQRSFHPSTPLSLRAGSQESEKGGEQEEKNQFITQRKIENTCKLMKLICIFAN